MNKRIDLTKTNGFPYSQDMLDFMQQSYRDAIGAIARSFGSLVIVTGVADMGTDWGNGWVAINGELMPFVGGVKAARVIVTETSATEVFEDTSVQNVYFTKQAVLAGAGGNAFADFVRLSTVQQLTLDIQTLFTTTGNKANKVQSAWQNFAFNSPWQAQNFPVKYRINDFGMVSFKGELWSNGTVITGANQLIATLPVGFRPASQSAFALNLFDGTSSRMLGLLTIDANGNVYINPNNPTTTMSSIKLDGIHFYID